MQTQIIMLLFFVAEVSLEIEALFRGLVCIFKDLMIVQLAGDYKKIASSNREKIHILYFFSQI
jgi:hypothetical protein